MTRHLIALTLLCLATPVTAQTLPSSAGAARKFTLTESVLAGGTPLAAGRYEIRFVSAGETTSESVSQRAVEILSNGQVVAREVAEIVPATGVAGTSGTAPSVRVEKLKEGDFVRVSFVEGGDRFLIYLPTRE